MTARRILDCSADSWPLKSPFTITGHRFTGADLLYVTITEGEAVGRGEGAGVYYLGETGDSMLADLERARHAIETGASREQLRHMMAAGGARNAIDCALWDLEAKQKGQTIWELTGIRPFTTRTALTIGIDTAERMAKNASALDSRVLKVKLDGDRPLEKVSAVRAARPDAEIIVDVNQGWSFEQLTELAPEFKALDVAMIEQPLPRGRDQELEGYQPPVPLCADESCLGVEEFEQAAGRYQVINIKLDKTGGLTEALELAALAKSRGLDVMVGNMMGTSLGMAPGFVVAQLCRFVDLDGALFLSRDRDHPIEYSQGVLSTPCRELWG